MRDLAALLSDPEWLVHRYDEHHDGFRFVHLTRDEHRDATFITDDYIEKTDRYEFVPRGELELAKVAHTQPKLVFHSAYCCSTMVARAFDLSGVSMGLKEPQVLNDILGWRRRGASADQVRQVLKDAIFLLSRPFSSGEEVVAKPSNIVSPLAKDMLDLFPEAKAVFLHAPIDSYLQSIVKKNLWGRRWVREVLIGTISDGYLVGGFEGQDLLELTDLQVAAVGWLSQHALFDRLLQTYGDDRVRTLDSATLLKDQRGSMRAMIDHLGVALSDDEFEEMMAGPAFSTHSKQSTERFGAAERAKEQASMAELHGEEIQMVVQWTQAVAQSQGLDLKMKGGLIP